MRLAEMIYTEEDMNELREENKKLKEERDDYMMKYANAMKDKVLECNKLATERNKLREENKEMNERIRYLEQCLDMKEKIFSQLREENKRLSDFLECEA